MLSASLGNKTSSLNLSAADGCKVITLLWVFLLSVITFTAPTPAYTGYCTHTPFFMALLSLLQVVFHHALQDYPLNSALIAHLICCLNRTESLHDSQKKATHSCLLGFPLVFNSNKMQMHAIYIFFCWLICLCENFRMYLFQFCHITPVCSRKHFLPRLLRAVKGVKE